MQKHIFQKLVSLFLTIVMIVGVMSMALISVSAATTAATSTIPADYDILFEIGSAEGSVGDIVSIPVYVTPATKQILYAFDILYPTDLLEYVGIDPTKEFEPTNFGDAYSYGLWEEGDVELSTYFYSGYEPEIGVKHLWATVKFKIISHSEKPIEFGYLLWGDYNDFVDAAITGSITVVPAICSADLNADGVVDVSDLKYLSNHLGKPSRYPLPEGVSADYTADGTIDTADLQYLSNHLGRPDRYPIPKMKT